MDYLLSTTSHAGSAQLSTINQMCITELNQAIQKLTSQPIAFLGGFFSGMFRLKLDDEPLKTWLEKQSVEA